MGKWHKYKYKLYLGPFFFFEYWNIQISMLITGNIEHKQADRAVSGLPPE